MHVKLSCDNQLNQFSSFVIRMYVHYVHTDNNDDRYGYNNKVLTKKATTHSFTLRGVSMLAH